jgi:hypothetical protein
MNSDGKKTFNYEILNLVKHYNFGIMMYLHVRLFENCKKNILKICEFRTNIWDPKWLQIKNLSTGQWLQLWY